MTQTYDTETTYVVMLHDPPNSTPNLVGPFESHAQAENWALCIVPASDDYTVLYVKTTEEWEGDDDDA